MDKVCLDASRWTTPRDFCDDLLAAVGAPPWHGRNLDALWDGLTGDLWDVKPPIVVEIVNCKGSALMRDGFLDQIAGLLADARMEGFDCSLILR